MQVRRQQQQQQQQAADGDLAEEAVATATDDEGWGVAWRVPREVVSAVAAKLSGAEALRAAQTLEVGDAVKGRHMASQIGPAGTSWFPAEVVRVHADGTVDLEYEDGDFEEHVKPVYVKRLAAA